MEPEALAESGAGLTWGELAEALESGMSDYGLLEPPPEVEAYHDARLRFLAAYGELARSRPEAQSVAEDYAMFAASVLPQLLQLASDETISAEEKERLADDLMQERLLEFVGAPFVAATLARDQAVAGMPEATRAVLAESGCHSAGEHG